MRQLRSLHRPERDLLPVSQLRQLDGLFMRSHLFLQCFFVFACIVSVAMIAITYYCAFEEWQQQHHYRSAFLYVLNTVVFANFVRGTVRLLQRIFPWSKQ